MNRLIQDLDDLTIEKDRKKFFITFATWLSVVRADPEKDTLFNHTNLMLRFNNEHGDCLGTCSELKTHPRIEDIDHCINKGMKMLMNPDTTEFRYHVFKNGVPTMRIFYDDRRRGLTGGITFMRTADWIAAGGTEEDVKNHPKKYTLIVNIRERKNQKCHNPECDKVSDRFQPCEGCMSVTYCSEECHRANWKNHKGDCKDGSFTQNL